MSLRETLHSLVRAGMNTSSSDVEGDILQIYVETTKATTAAMVVTKVNPSWQHGVVFMLLFLVRNEYKKNLQHLVVLTTRCTKLFSLDAEILTCRKAWCFTPGSLLGHRFCTRIQAIIVSSYVMGVVELLS